MMGRKKAGNGGILGILLLFAIGLAIHYWVYVLILGGVGFSIYLLVRMNDPKVSPQLPPAEEKPSRAMTGIRIEVTHSTGRPSTRKQGVNRVTFHEKEESISINGLQIPAYLLYVGESDDELPHLIRPSLDVAQMSEGMEPRMGYWPNYESIQPTDRACYLSWLASGRKNIEADIGLVFLYFYGLEYRAIQEKKNHPDIFSEALRLFSLYGSKNRSFRGYCSKFLCWLVHANPDWNQEIVTLRELLEANPEYSKSFTSLSDRFLPGADKLDSLFAQLAQEPSFQDDPTFQGAPQEFHALFRHYLKEWTPEAEEREGAAPWIYQTATSLHLTTAIQRRVFKPSAETMKLLKKTWRECRRDLAPYAAMREMDHPFSSLRLPEEIRENFSRGVSDEVGRFLDFPAFKLTTARDAAQIVGLSIPEKMSIAFSRTVRDRWGIAGYALEPDPSYSGRSYKPDDPIVVYKKPEKEDRPEQMKKSILLFDLGMSVAVAEKELVEAESEHVLRFVASHLSLRPGEEMRLQMRLLLYKTGKLTASSVTRKLAASLNLSEGKTIATFLIAVAAVDGVLDAAEKRVLERSFKALSLPAELLTELLEKTRAPGDAPVLLRQSRPSRGKGSSIPREPLSESERITLDPKALESAFAEAAEVSRILSSVFTEETGESESSEEPPGSSFEKNSSMSQEAALKPAEDLFLEWLMTKPEWESAEIEDKCRELGMMYGSAVRRLNDWAERTFGDLLLEEDDETVLVHRDLLKRGA